MRRLYQTKSKVIVFSLVILLIALCASLCVFKIQTTQTIKSNVSLNAIPEGVNIQSEVYNVEEGYISRILPETTLRDLKNNIDKEDITVTKKDGSLLEDTEFVGAGMKLTYGGKEYKLAVVDDLNGDGKAGITDLTQMKLTSVGLRAKLVNEYEKAGDINNDGRISITDVTKSNLASVNLIDILAPASFTPEAVSTKDTITILGETSDSNSGIKEYWFEINNNGWVSNTDKLNNKYTFTGLNMETKYTIRMKVVDNAGNVKITKRVEIETLNEENANISIVASTEEWTNNNILVAINFNSNVAKEKKQISLDNGNTWIDYTAPITVEKNMVIKARVVNSRGVVLEEQQKAITNIDKLAPKQFTITTSADKQSITVNASTQDSEATSEYASSGIKEYEYTLINGHWKWTKTSEENECEFNLLRSGETYTVQVTAIDFAGNKTTAEETQVQLVITATLTFNANGGTVEPTRIVADYNESITMPTPTREHTVTFSVGNDALVVPQTTTATYTFDGWYTDATEGVERNYTTMPEEDETLYAHWDNTNASITLPEPTRSGYEFKGWYSDSECTEENIVGVAGDTYTPKTDITLYAKWEKLGIYVTLYDDGTLTFTATNKQIEGKTAVKAYGDIYENEFSRYDTQPWKGELNNITTVDIVDEIQPISTAYWFESCNNLTTINNIDNLNTSNVTNMTAMFCNCYRLTNLDVTNFDTSNVVYMGCEDEDLWYKGMFWGCSGLTSLDVSNFDTSNVTSMRGMFGRCSGLTNLDISNFDTSNATYMDSMFNGCSSLTSLDVRNFDTSNVTHMDYMFDGCSGLKSLDVSNFDTSNVTMMNGIFSGCSGLTSLDVSNFDTGNVIYMGVMFCGCSGLTSLDVSNFNTSNVTDMMGMFSGCSGLTSLDISNLDTSKVTDMGHMFENCGSLTSLDLSNLNTSNVTSMLGMFDSCNGLTSLNVSNFDTRNVTDMSGMFYNCSSLTRLDLSRFDTSNVIYMGNTSNGGYTMNYGMFGECSGLTNLDISNFDTSNVIDMSDMFIGCSGLTSLDVSNFDTSNVTDMNGMFSNCSNLTSLDVSNFNTSNVTDMSDMFRRDTKLQTIYVGSKWQIASNTDHMFEGCGTNTTTRK